MSDPIPIPVPDSADPWIHKIGKFAVAGIVTFIAGELAEKAYDAVLEAYRKNH